MGKAKCFADGGNVPSNTYPFANPNAASSPINTPSVTVGTKPEPLSNPTETSTDSVQAFKKGGAVRSSASKRADGCAQRGKTRA
jgi:hypothetical protein